MVGYLIILRVELPNGAIKGQKERDKGGNSRLLTIQWTVGYLQSQN